MGESPAVTDFREYLRIQSDHPNPDYDAVLHFLKDKAAVLELPCCVIEVVPKKLVALITWEGTDCSLPSILLCSHTDVVPVVKECWKYDPFGGYKDELHNIYGRGAQDMKSVGIQYLEAIRRLKNNGTRLLRTVHLAFLPDEEIGGDPEVMAAFMKTKEFKKMNVGVGLDEGIANPTNACNVFYGEKTLLWLKFVCTGSTGHGSLFIKNSPGEKLRRVINSLLAFREEEEKRLKKDPSLQISDVATVNLTKIEGGVEMNVVPPQFTAYFDVRLPPQLEIQEFKSLVSKWCADAGDGVTCDYIQENEAGKLTSISRNDPWWNALSTAFESMNLQIHTNIFPGLTNGRFLRQKGIPAYGFSPMNNTPVLLHNHNEYLNEDVFLKGCDIYCGVIASLANVV